MILAARGSTWGGMVVGLIALGVFLVFSSVIVAQRIRANRKDRAND